MAQYVVEAILDSAFIDDTQPELGRLWLIKWENYDSSQNTWEPKSNLAHLDLFKMYERSQSRYPTEEEEEEDRDDGGDDDYVYPQVSKQETKQRKRKKQRKKIKIKIKKSKHKTKTKKKKKRAEKKRKQKKPKTKTNKTITRKKNQNRNRFAIESDSDGEFEPKSLRKLIHYTDTESDSSDDAPIMKHIPQKRALSTTTASSDLAPARKKRKLNILNKEQSPLGLIPKRRNGSMPSKQTKRRQAIILSPRTRNHPSRVPNAMSIDNVSAPRATNPSLSTNHSPRVSIQNVWTPKPVQQCTKKPILAVNNNSATKVNEKREEKERIVMDLTNDDSDEELPVPLITNRACTPCTPSSESSSESEQMMEPNTNKNVHHTDDITPPLNLNPTPKPITVPHKISTPSQKPIALPTPTTRHNHNNHTHVHRERMVNNFKADAHRNRHLVFKYDEKRTSLRIKNLPPIINRELVSHLEDRYNVKIIHCGNIVEDRYSRSYVCDQVQLACESEKDFILKLSRQNRLYYKKEPIVAQQYRNERATSSSRHSSSSPPRHSYSRNRNRNKNRLRSSYRRSRSPNRSRKHSERHANHERQRSEHKEQRRNKTKLVNTMKTGQEIQHLFENSWKNPGVWRSNVTHAKSRETLSNNATTAAVEHVEAARKEKQKEASPLLIPPPPPPMMKPIKKKKKTRADKNILPLPLPTECYSFINSFRLFGPIADEPIYVSPQEIITPKCGNTEDNWFDPGLDDMEGTLKGATLVKDGDADEDEAAVKEAVAKPLPTATVPKPPTTTARRLAPGTEPKPPRKALSNAARRIVTAPITMTFDEYKSRIEAEAKQREIDNLIALKVWEQNKVNEYEQIQLMQQIKRESIADVSLSIELSTSLSPFINERAGTNERNIRMWRTLIRLFVFIIAIWTIWTIFKCIADSAQSTKTWTIEENENEIHYRSLIHSFINMPTQMYYRHTDNKINSDREDSLHKLNTDCDKNINDSWIRYGVDVFLWIMFVAILLICAAKHGKKSNFIFGAIIIFGLFRFIQNMISHNLNMTHSEMMNIFSYFVSFGAIPCCILLPISVHITRYLNASYQSYFNPQQTWYNYPDPNAAANERKTKKKAARNKKPELFTQENVLRDAYSPVPSNYFCAACNAVGKHWVMECPINKVLVSGDIVPTPKPRKRSFDEMNEYNPFPQGNHSNKRRRLS